MSEGLAIEKEDPETLINGKGEYGTNKIPKYKIIIENGVVQERKETPSQAQNIEVDQNPQGNKRTQTETSDHFDNQLFQRKKRTRMEAKDSIVSNGENRPSMCSIQEPQKERTSTARCAPSVQPTFSGCLEKSVSRHASTKALTISKEAHRTQNE